MRSTTFRILATAVVCLSAASAVHADNNPFLPKTETAKPARAMPIPPVPRANPVPPNARSVGTINGTRVYFNSEENRYVFQTESASDSAQAPLPAPPR